MSESVELPKPLPKPAACVFDLDGTLVDSLRDVAGALNEALALLGLPTHPVEAYRYMVGEGVPVLCQRAVGASNPGLVPQLIELVRPLYRARVLDHTRPYPGVDEMIQKLGVLGVHLGVLSNKPHDLTVRIVGAFWGAGQFELVNGYAEEGLRKPAPNCLLRMCAEWSLSPAEVWVVGDTPTDVATAHAAGAVPIGVTWGFRSRGDLVDAGVERLVDTPGELAELVAAAR